MTEPIRDRLVRVAESYVGVTAPDQRLLDLIAPYDAHARQAEIATSSLCELVALGLYEQSFELRDRGPYHTGAAPVILQQALDGWITELSVRRPSAGGLRLATLELPPQVGDGIWYEGAPGHSEHVDACITAIQFTDKSILYDVIAGGQKTPEGKQTIKKLHRGAERPDEGPRELQWDPKVSRWFDVATKRRVWAVLDAGLIAARFEAKT